MFTYNIKEIAHEFESMQNVSLNYWPDAVFVYYNANPARYLICIIDTAIITFVSRQLIQPPNTIFNHIPTMPDLFTAIHKTIDKNSISSLNSIRESFNQSLNSLLNAIKTLNKSQSIHYLLTI